MVLGFEGFRCRVKGLKGSSLGYWGFKFRVEGFRG